MGLVDRKRRGAPRGHEGEIVNLPIQEEEKRRRGEKDHLETAGLLRPEAKEKDVVGGVPSRTHPIQGGT